MMFYFCDIRFTEELSK